MEDLEAQGAAMAGEAGDVDKPDKADKPDDLGDGGGEPRMDAAEHLVVELARLRAKFSVDPAAGQATLDDAWSSPATPIEEDEAEFIDAVADCLGVGLSLDAALDCWDAGGLCDEAAGGDEESDAQDSETQDPDKIHLASLQPSRPRPPSAPHARPGGRRLLIS